MKFLKFDMDRESTSLYFEFDQDHMVKIEFRDNLFHAYKYEKIEDGGFGKQVGKYQSGITPSSKELNFILDKM